MFILTIDPICKLESTLEESLLVSDNEHPQNTKHVKNDISARASSNDKQVILPSGDTVESSKCVTEKVSKKRTLKRNVTTIVNLQTPPKQVKQLDTQVIQEQPSGKQQSQSLLLQSTDNGPSTDTPLEQAQKTQSPNSIRTTATTMVEPVTPKSSKNLETSSLSELESPVASLIFSQSGDNTTTSQDESCSCVEESENESTSLTQQSQDTSSVQQSQDESAVTDEFDSDFIQKTDTELEDSDDCHERMNAKLCVERDVSQGNEMKLTCVLFLRR